ncbi:Metallothionein-like protein [Actinidia chinensis var. chinensis]|uniref:Metallothionein-like protein n=1 Tax=Actinidia chinensis var. chinensis TaxID=1590841 RepID=A0A2R6PQ17_ACTCC|nr:Metallothionein-like protein [Actinidia chinensis var. chinensis]
MSACGCEMNPDVETASTATVIAVVAPPVKMHSEESEKSFGTEGGCKCGDSCACDPCTC